MSKTHFINNIHRVCFVTDDSLNITKDSGITNEQKWEQYLQNMRDGHLWADAVSIQGLSDALNVTVCILSSIGRNMVVASSSDMSSNLTVHVGQIMEKHYVTC